ARSADAPGPRAARSCGVCRTACRGDPRDRARLGRGPPGRRGCPIPRGCTSGVRRATGGGHRERGRADGGRGRRVLTGRYILALDQGTTSSRAILFDHSGAVVASAAHEFPQVYPSPGHVTHDPEAIWSSQLAAARDCMSAADAAAGDVAAIGVTNQRETTIVWERSTGRPVADAIVWQSRITAPFC